MKAVSSAVSGQVSRTSLPLPRYWRCCGPAVSWSNESKSTRMTLAVQKLVHRRNVENIILQQGIEHRAHSIIRLHDAQFLRDGSCPGEWCNNSGGRRDHRRV